MEESAAEEPAGATDAKPGKKNRRKSKPARKNKPAAAETPSIAVPGPETVKQPRRVTVFTQVKPPLFPSFFSGGLLRCFGDVTRLQKWAAAIARGTRYV